ncbi:MAG: DUF1330 domain-containing protein [Bacteroidota bacterium]
MSDSYIHVTQEAGRAFMQRGLVGEITMLNLLRFRDVADYSEAPNLAPDTPISGAAAYDRYIEHTLPFLDAAGSEVTFMGEGGAFVIGPPEERWDLVLLVRHQSLNAFMGFATDAAYLVGAGHRTAALADSRLLPLIETTGALSSASD